MTRGKKFLFGCLGGCGFIVLVGLGSCIGFTVWINSPGAVLEPDILLGPETAGYVEWTLRLEDPGTAEFVEAMIQNLGSMNQTNSPLPEGLQQFLNARQRRSARKDLERLFPVVVAWTARPGETADEEEHLLSASARGASHQMLFLDWIGGYFIGRADEIETVRHRDERIYVFRDFRGVRPAAFIRRGIVFVATDLDSAIHTLDRVAVSTERGAAGTELAALFAGLDPESPLRGALTNRRGELMRVLDIFDLPDDDRAHEGWGDVRGVTISAEFRDQEVFGGAVELHGPHGTWARENEAALGAAVAALFGRTKLEFVTEVRAVGERIRIEFTSEDLFGEIKDLVEDH